jgi:para-aminobenzoate synthetase/4-amino-4-deoxychorismate lyase
LLLDAAGPALDVGPLPPELDHPVSLDVDDVPVDPEDRWLYHKTTQRQRYEQAAARHPQADDVVLVNNRGEVTETTIASLAVRIAGRWWTPRLSCGCLPGVERARLLADATLAERTITVDELRAAEAVAVVSSLRGWRPAALI